MRVDWRDRLFLRCVDIFNDALTSTPHANHPDVRSILYALKQRPDGEGFAKVGKAYDRLPRPVRRQTRESAIMIARLRAGSDDEDIAAFPGGWGMGM